jgi:hypothetical protein
MAPTPSRPEPAAVRRRRGQGHRRQAEDHRALGGSLFKANEIKRAVQTGQTQAGEFILSGAANENALFGIDSIPFLATSYAEARRLYDIANPVQEKVLAGPGHEAAVLGAVARPVAVQRPSRWTPR